MTVRRTPMLLAVAALAALAVCGPAQSAFPGANGRIAFVSDSSEIPPAGLPQIYSIDPDGTDQTRLTTSFSVDREPAWSPDGTKIAFSRTPASIDATFANVFFMHADGSGQTNLTNALTSFNTDPAWSPAGNALAFVSDRVNSTTDIFRMNADGTGQFNLTNTVDVRESNPSWSPDGSRIAYDTGGSVWAMNADGTDQTNLTGSNFWEDREPSWSPTGDKIVFSSNRDDSSLVNHEIYVMSPDGSGATRLTNHVEADFAPRWSPDGTKIVFESFRDGPPAGIYVLDLANPTNPPVRVGTQVSATFPDWQPLPGPDNSTPGTNVSVAPVDLTTGDSPVTITFGQVTATGVTTLVTSGVRGHRPRTTSRLQVSTTTSRPPRSSPARPRCASRSFSRTRRRSRTGSASHACSRPRRRTTRTWLGRLE